MSQLELFGSFAQPTASQTSPFGKTSPESSPATVAETLLSSSKKWSTSGRVTLRGESWTAASSELPSVAAECSLSQILEANAPGKYFLSPKACAGILRRAENRGKKLPAALATALEQVALSPASGPRGGGPAGDEHYNLVVTHVPSKAACLETTNHDYSRADGFTAVAFNRQEGSGGTLGMKDSATMAVRRLTPVECCRLQGFPDDWNNEGIDKNGKRFSMADAPRYRQLGNAVTTNVVNWIANNLARVYTSAKESHNG